jgi:hypothetical protein
MEEKIWEQEHERVTDSTCTFCLAHQGWSWGNCWKVQGIINIEGSIGFRIDVALYSSRILDSEHREKL